MNRARIPSTAQRLRVLRNPAPQSCGLDRFEIAPAGLGYLAGRAGAPHDVCPYAIGTPERDDWIGGYCRAGDDGMSGAAGLIAGFAAVLAAVVILGPIILATID